MFLFIFNSNLFSVKSLNPSSHPASTIVPREKMKVNESKKSNSFICRRNSRAWKKAQTGSRTFVHAPMNLSEKTYFLGGRQIILVCKQESLSVMAEF